MAISLSIQVALNLKRPTRVKGRAAPSHQCATPFWPCIGWGLPSLCVATELVSSYLAISPLSRNMRDGVFSVALSLGLPPVPVRDHPALRCPDFPPRYAKRPPVYPYSLLPSLQGYRQFYFSLSVYILC